MCYDLTFVEIKRLEWELKQSSDPASRQKIREHLERLKQGTIFWDRGFAHPKVPVIYMGDGNVWLDMMRWGLVPRWCRDQRTAHQYWNNTLNCRGEEMFEKPSFRASALDRRCIIVVNGFYEYHHQGKLSFPFFIRPKDGGLMYLGGLWDRGAYEGADPFSVTIVTVAANPVMAKIHNSPKNPGRMPLVIPEEFHEQWLTPTSRSDKLAIERLKKEILLPYDADLLSYDPVRRPTGVHGIGNDNRMHEPFAYPEYTHIF